MKNLGLLIAGVSHGGLFHVHRYFDVLIF